MQNPGNPIKEKILIKKKKKDEIIGTKTIIYRHIYVDRYTELTIEQKHKTLKIKAIHKICQQNYQS